MRKLIPCAALVCGVAVLTGPLGAEDKPGDARLEGGYTIVSGESGGKALPADRVEGHTVRFTADRIVSTDKNKKDVYVATYRLESGKSQWVIRMKAEVPKKDVEAVGLIKKEGDTVTLIYALPGGAAPTDFKTKENQNLFVLKNLNKGEKPKP